MRLEGSKNRYFDKIPGRIFIKKIKALWHYAKGLELSGSPYWSGSELLKGI